MLVFALFLASFVLNIDPVFSAPDDLMPGSKEYYEAKWEEAKFKAGNIPAGTDYMDQAQKTVMDGPWELDLDWGGSLTVKILS